MYFDRQAVGFSGEERFTGSHLGRQLDVVYEGFSVWRDSQEHFSMPDLDLVRYWPSSWFQGMNSRAMSNLVELMPGESTQYEKKMTRQLFTMESDHDMVHILGDSIGAFDVPHGNERLDYVRDQMGEIGDTPQVQALKSSIDSEDRSAFSILKGYHEQHVPDLYSIDPDQRIARMIASVPIGNFEGRSQ